jgi:hypothetical protein
MHVCMRTYLCVLACTYTLHTYVYVHTHTHVALVQLLQYYTRESADTCVDALNLGKQSRLTADRKPLSGICNTCVVA